MLQKMKCTIHSGGKSTPSGHKMGKWEVHPTHCGSFCTRVHISSPALPCTSSPFFLLRRLPTPHPKRHHVGLARGHTWCGDLDKQSVHLARRFSGRSRKGRKRPAIKIAYAKTNPLQFPLGGVVGKHPQSDSVAEGNFRDFSIISQREPNHDLQKDAD